jgi:hypothetical protein
MSSPTLACVLVNHPELPGFEDVIRYLDLIRCLKPTIAMQEALYHHGPPDTITVNIHEFLKICLDFSDEAKLAWATLRRFAWDYNATEDEDDALRQKYVKLFMEHGLFRGISKFSSLIPYQH